MLMLSPLQIVGPRSRRRRKARGEMLTTRSWPQFIYLFLVEKAVSVCPTDEARGQSTAVVLFFFFFL